MLYSLLNKAHVSGTGSYMNWDVEYLVCDEARAYLRLLLCIKGRCWQCAFYILILFYGATYHTLHHGLTSMDAHMTAANQWKYLSRSCIEHVIWNMITTSLSAHWGDSRNRPLTFISQTVLSRIHDIRMAYGICSGIWFVIFWIKLKSLSLFCKYVLREIIDIYQFLGILVYLMFTFPIAFRLN